MHTNRRTRLLVFAVFVLAGMAFFLSCTEGLSDTQPLVPIDAGSINDCTGSFDYMVQIKQANLAVASLMRPGDRFWLGFITSNSVLAEPLAYAPVMPQNKREAATLLHAKDSIMAAIAARFDSLAREPYSKTDLYNAIDVASSVLRNSSSNIKILFIFSDFNETVGSRPQIDLNGIHVVVLFVYPQNRNPVDYRKHVEAVTAILAAGHPQTLRVLSPAEAMTFDYATFLSALKGGQQ